MPSESKFIKVTEFWLLFFILLVKNAIFIYLFQKLGFSNRATSETGIFYAVFAFIDWLVFWWALRSILHNFRKNMLMLLLSFSISSIPYFLNKSIIKFDYENLFIQSVCYFVPFLIFVGIKKSPKLIGLPLLMAFVPLINLQLGNSFSANLSIFRPFFNSGILQIPLSNDINLDLGMVIVQSMFWMALIILFYEMNHQFFGIFSWRFEVEMPLNKPWLITAWVIFKSLIYWLLASLIVVMLGNSSLPFFSNKVSMAFNGLGIIGLLTILTIYFRKYISLYFYDKTGTSNWIFIWYFIPFLDLIALLTSVIFPFSLMKKFVRKWFSPKNIALTFALFTVIYSIFSYTDIIRKIPSNQSDLFISLTLSRIFLPLFMSVLCFISVKNVTVYKILMVLLMVGVIPFKLFIIPELEKSGNIALTVNTIQFYFQTVVFLFFLYPVFYFERFLKLQ
jgi:hypothetical protein